VNVYISNEFVDDLRKVGQYCEPVYGCKNKGSSEILQGSFS
jgi:hypothetical protein